MPQTRLCGNQRQPKVVASACEHWPQVSMGVLAAPLGPTRFASARQIHLRDTSGLGDGYKSHGVGVRRCGGVAPLEDTAVFEVLGARRAHVWLSGCVAWTAHASAR